MRTAWTQKIKCEHYPRRRPRAARPPPISVRASSRLARLRSRQAASFLPRPLTGSLYATHQTNNLRFLFPVTFSLNLKRQAPLLGALQLVHAAGQISYLLI